MKRDQYPTKKFDLKLKELYGKRIREKHRQYLEKTSSQREQHRGEKEQVILQVIKMYYYSEGGISHNKLVNIVHLDRKSLRPYTQSLLKNGLIKRDGNEHHGKYVPTRKPSYTDLLLRSSLFADDFRFNSLNAAGLPRFSVLYEYNGYGPSLIFGKPPNNKDPVDATLVDFTAYTKYYEPRFTEQDRLERTLFESSNRIGAFITYAIIQAMNLSNDEMLSLSKGEQDQFTTDWVHTCISQVVPHLISFFKESAYTSMGSYPRVENPKVKYIKEIQTSELNKSFEKLYPYLSYKLRKSIDRLPESLENYKKLMESLNNESKMQKKLQTSV